MLETCCFRIREGMLITRRRPRLNARGGYLKRSTLVEDVVVRKSAEELKRGAYEQEDDSCCLGFLRVRSYSYPTQFLAFVTLVFSLPYDDSFTSKIILILLVSCTRLNRLVCIYHLSIISAFICRMSPTAMMSPLSAGLLHCQIK